MFRLNTDTFLAIFSDYYRKEADVQSQGRRRLHE